MDDKLFALDKDDFPWEIGEAGKFGIIEEEEKGNKKVKNTQKQNFRIGITIIGYVLQ